MPTPNKSGAKQSTLLGFFSKVPASQAAQQSSKAASAGPKLASSSSTIARTHAPSNASPDPAEAAGSLPASSSLALETPPPTERRSSSGAKAQTGKPNGSVYPPVSQPSSSPTYARSSSLTTSSLLPSNTRPASASKESSSDDLTPPPSSDLDNMELDEDDEDDINDQPLFRRRAAAKRPITYAESDSDGAHAGGSDSSDDEGSTFARRNKSQKRTRVQSKRARKIRDEDDFIVPDDEEEEGEEALSDAVMSDVGEEGARSAVLSEEDQDDDDDTIPPRKKGRTGGKAPPSAPRPTTSAVKDPANSTLSVFELGRSHNGGGRSDASSARYQTLSRNGASPSASGLSLSHLTKAERRVIEEKRKRAENEQAYSFLVDLRDKDGNRPGDANYDPRTVYIPKSAWKDFTPFEEQFWRIKQNHWDTVLFFQKGKFYELYEEDALIGHREFDLKLTDRVKMKMVGVPEASFDVFAAKFLALGYKVGRVDQTETAVAKGMRVGEKSRGGGSEIVNRELRHVLTSGTIVDASSLPDDLNNYCISIKEDLETGRNGPVFGVCTLDASTAEFNLTEFEDDESRTRLETLLRSLRLKEVLHEKAGLSPQTLRVLRSTVPMSAQVTMLKAGSEFFDHETTLRKLNTLFNAEVASDFRLDSVAPISDLSLLPGGIASMIHKSNAISALGGLLSYLTQLNLDRDLCSSRNFNIFDPLRQDNCLVLDAQSLTHLNVLQNDEGTDQGTLHRLLNRCVTPFGKRLFKIWMIAPLAAIEAIRARQDAVDDLLAHPMFSDDFDAFGKALPDIERIIPRIHAGKCRPRDFTAVLKALAKIDEGVSQLRSFCRNFDTDVVESLLTSIPSVSTIAKELQSSFKMTENGSFNPIGGVFVPYDDAVEALTEVENQLESEIELYRKQLKLNSNRCNWKHLGTKDIYQIEVPVSTKVPPNWTKLSGTKDKNRFYSPKVRDLVQELKEARETRLAALKQFHQSLFVNFAKHSKTFLQAIKAIAEMDCLVSLAKASYAMGEPVCRPELVENETALLQFEQLRHPCMAGENVDFIPNDIRLGGKNDEVVILTGGNMAGKSTTARTSATAVILAQLGCRVPAAKARLSPVDRIASRMGANDQIFRNNSTFMVEMLEASRIINECTPRSLVIMDELGRGTSTFDGQAIAFAVLHHLVSRTRCLTFFLTHYTNLAYDFDAYSRVSNKHMQVLVDEAKREVVFTYRLISGIAESSYGTQVAALAGVPHDICDRAAAVSKQFAEATKANQAEKNQSAIPLALLSDFVHLWKTAKCEPADKSDRQARSKALTIVSQLGIVRSQIAALASASAVHVALPSSSPSEAESTPTPRSERAIDGQRRPNLSITTTYGGRNRRALTTEDIASVPRPATPVFGAGGGDHDDGDDISDSLYKSRSSPIPCPTPTLFPSLSQRLTTRKTHAKRISRRAAPDSPEQLILDLGQKIRVRCPKCDMQYDSSSAEDVALHTRHHERVIKGLDWTAKALSVHGEVVAEAQMRQKADVGILEAKRNNATTCGSWKGEEGLVEIVRYDMSTIKDSLVQRKMGELLDGVDEALGAANLDAALVRTCKVFVAVSAGRAVGTVVVGQITKGSAREVLPSAAGKENTAPSEPGMLWNDAGDAILVSESLPASRTPPVGIYRVHVIPTWRRSGIASKLLETAADHSVYGVDLQTLIRMYGSRAKAVAFSQPTEAGRKLAEAWIRRGEEAEASLVTAPPRLIVFEA